VGDFRGRDEIAIWYSLEGNVMAITGMIMVGGFAVGAVVVHLTVDDGTKWEFRGGLVPLVDFSISVPVTSAVFGGLSHIAGSCGLAFVLGGTPVGGIAMRFFDMHGEIGHIEALTVNLGVGGGGGGGTWTKVTEFG
jgi:hypothetical protein